MKTTTGNIITSDPAVWQRLERHVRERTLSGIRLCNARNDAIIRRAKQRDWALTLIVVLIAASAFMGVALAVSSALLGGGQ